MVNQQFPAALAARTLGKFEMLRLTMPPSFRDDHAIAASIATEAGQLLLDVRRSGLPPDRLRTEGDEQSHAFIMRRLASDCAGDAVLSEEGADQLVRLASTRVWIVDPLDGPREFSEIPRDDWAVHVALLNSGRLTAGAVALPAKGLTLSTADPPSAPPPHGDRLRLLVSRTRPTEHARALAAALDAELVAMGSAGAKVAAVVLGDADVYAHSGGQYEWDSAAPVAVAAAAGLHVSRLDGSPLKYNQPDPWLPDVLVCRADLADAVLTAMVELDE
jgi:3'(2'), 5'-bisphosphate nucleotidase